MKVAGLAEKDFDHKNCFQTVYQSKHNKNNKKKSWPFDRDIRKPRLVKEQIPVPSDHYRVCAIPISAHEVTNHRTKLIKLIRPVPESSIRNFEAKIETQDFQFLHSSPVPSMVDNFQSLLTRIMSETFPEKRITITPYDQPGFTEELRKTLYLRL